MKLLKQGFPSVHSIYLVTLGESCL